MLRSGEINRLILNLMMILPLEELEELTVEERIRLASEAQTDVHGEYDFDDGSGGSGTSGHYGV